MPLKHQDHKPIVFVVSDSFAKQDQNARKLIRSHVMRGKNRRKPVDRPILKSWINVKSTQDVQSDHLALYFPPPVQLGSDLPLTQFACEMPPYALDLVFKFFAVVGQAMYPIELCLTFDLHNSKYVEYLAVDALYCHGILWMSQAYFDWAKGNGYSYIQLLHANKTLAMIQQRLNDCELATSDATVSAVVGLVMVSALMGEKDSTKKHMVGLYTMVELRGGITAFTENSHLQVKICRADLVTAMLIDNTPMFFSEGISWEPYIAKLRNISCTTVPVHLAALDPKLSNVWADLRDFSRSANLAFQTGQKMDCIQFQEILISIQYRLQLLNICAPSLDRAVHVGMLAYSTNVFLQLQGLAGLSAKLRDSILGLQDTSHLATAEFKLWLLFIARMSIVVAYEDSWIHFEMSKALQILGLSSWTAVREKLKQYLWIDKLHDKGAEVAFYNATNASPDPE